TRLLNWLPLRDQFLDELLRHDGLQEYLTLPYCDTYKNSQAIYRCTDCFLPKPQCQACIVTSHRLLPLHQIEGWTGNFWDKTSLHELGLQFYLGHSGDKCPGLTRSTKMTVFDISGVHTVSVVWCSCSAAERITDNFIQLLRARWFPATTKQPRTVFTFNCLNTFHLLTLHAKISLYDFYRSIISKTDNARVYKTIYRWNEISLISRQWRHLKMLKCTGRGHAPGGAATTEKGACAILCPACPQRDINLPKD
ncbi:hypothetical protein CERSUDRAFT_60827, partial [Gelatoporia subvermispora B]